MKRIFALFLSFAVLFSCLSVTASAMFDPSPVYDVKAQSAYVVTLTPTSSSTKKTARNRCPPGA